MSRPNYYNGKTITEWANEIGMKRSTLANRIKEGWTIEEAISVPYAGHREREKSIFQIAVENKMSHKTLKKRLAIGMTIEEALGYDYKQNLIGKRFGRLIVLEEVESKRDKNGRPRRRYLCLCDCGRTVYVLGENLTNGNTQSCGCLRNELSAKRREKDLVGQTFGRWYIESEAYRDKYGIHWNAICECGNSGTPTTGNLIQGNTKSCGCYNRDCISERERKDITGQKFFKLTAEECVGKNEYNNYLWRCVCECGREIITTASRLLGGQIVSCGCTRSKGECLIEEFFKEKKIQYKKNVHFDDLKLKGLLLFDFGIWDQNNNIYLIEYQGEQHYKNISYFGKQQRNVTDAMKKEYCNNKNIILYEIRYDENINEKLEEIITYVNPVLSKQ